MLDIFYIWIAAGVFFLIIEMMSWTLFWLSMSIASFIVAAYAYFMKDVSIDIIQIVIFTFFSTLLVFIFPKFFHLAWPKAKIWADVYSWKTYKLKKVWEDWKVSIEWVDYLIWSDSVTEGFAVNKVVEVVSNNWGVLNVKLK